MRVLVTGGAGYLGSVLVPMLIAGGYEVDVMDIQEPVAGNWINRDIFACPVSEADLVNVGAVIHLAAVVGLPQCDSEPQRAVEVNFLATKYLARACKKAGVRLIFASTCSVYGIKNELCKEDTEPEANSVYGLTKLQAERDVLSAGGTALRMATIFGISPRMRYDLTINEFARQAKTEGQISIFGGGQMRPYLGIRSAADAFIRCLTLEEISGIFNLADESIRILELGRIVGEIFGCKVNVITEIVDKRSYAIDSSKAMKVLGLRPKPLKEGIYEMKGLVV